MSIIFICAIMIILTGGWAFYAASDIKNQHRLLKIREDEHERIKRDFDADFNKQHHDFELKKQEARKQINESWAMINDARDKFISMKDQIKILKQQVVKLQAELENSRQRSKRLAKKAKNTV
jgi:hypothetical protein